ncbi:hypothetical protein LYNGBM3L_43850 [Moorena producens 3L]|uniref:Transposase n=1 Tax=Moorena producens 3L TaxID=489825 RepID=F4XWD1_9CYAN|nr:hypothetical protein LYNGBM3L_43850 [Moorena producens 3L]
MYLKGKGFRAIERIHKVNHNTGISWVKQIGNQLPDYHKNYKTPQVGKLD